MGAATRRAHSMYLRNNNVSYLTPALTYSFRAARALNTLRDNAFSIRDGGGASAARCTPAAPVMAHVAPLAPHSTPLCTMYRRLHLNLGAKMARLKKITSLAGASGRTCGKR